MELSESRRKEYKETAESMVQNHLNNVEQEGFVKTCSICNLPLKDSKLSDKKVGFRVESILGGLHTGNVTINYRCPEHIDHSMEQPLDPKVITIIGRVEIRDGGELELQVSSRKILNW